MQICSRFSLCLPALGSRSRLTRLTSSQAYRVSSGSVPVLPKAAAVLRPTLFPSLGTRLSTGSLSALPQGNQATLRGRYSWPVTRRRHNGFHLCADACLLVTGLSHDNWPGRKLDVYQCPEVDDSVFCRWHGFLQRSKYVAVEGGMTPSSRHASSNTPAVPQFPPQVNYR